MKCIAALLLLAGSGTSAFVAPSNKPAFDRCLSLDSAKGGGEKEVVQQRAFTVGTLVEFQEKKRVHVGKILGAEHKSNGGARYEVEDHDGKHFNIADKAVSYAMPISPDDERRRGQIFDDFHNALEEPEMELRRDLDISPELLEMAWEEAAEDDAAHHELTAPSLFDLVHSRTASAIETYKAWRLLKTDMAHVLFKEIKHHGRVTSFKAKARKAVDAAKQTFCTKADNAEDDFCWV